jgi:hypothetical protein
MDINEIYATITEKLMGIEVFDFTEVEMWDDGFLYKDPIYKFESLKQYDNMPINLTIGWDFKVWDSEGNIYKQFNIIDVPEFKDELRKLV